eukprot:scaffold3218_cov51-Phaeocystis_antarctica.AAC.1
MADASEPEGEEASEGDGGCARSRTTVAVWPCVAATQSAVSPSPSTCAGSAPAARSAVTAVSCPASHAHSSGVPLRALGWLGSAPCCTSNAWTSVQASSVGGVSSHAASMSGVVPCGSRGAFTLSPPPSSRATSSRLPAATAARRLHVAPCAASTRTT